MVAILGAICYGIEHFIRHQRGYHTAYLAIVFQLPLKKKTKKKKQINVSLFLSEKDGISNHTDVRQK